ncbi:T9SS type A sorting domain-containing protein [Candidatus Cloacimonadota bacterium]
MRWIICLILFTGCLNAQNLLNGPEGIFYHSDTSTYYVANALDGKIITIDMQSVHDEFVTGLNMPMEVLIVNEILYVTANDPKKLYGFNINSGEMVLDIAINEATGLSGMCFDDRTDMIYIADQGGRIFTFNVSSEDLEIYIDTGEGISSSVQDIALDIPNNRLVVCFYAYSLALKEIDLETGSVSTISGTGGGNHVGINMDTAGHFYVSNWSTNEILYYNNDFSTNGIFSSGQNQPVGITFNYDIDFMAVANFGGNTVDLIFMYLTDLDDNEIPDSGELDLKIFPNPFNPATTISFANKEYIDTAMISIYNLKGQQVREFPVTKLFSQNEERTSVIWDGRDNDKIPVVSGIYFCSLQAGNNSAVEKIVLLK